MTTIGNLSEQDFETLYRERGRKRSRDAAATQHGNYLIYWFRCGDGSWSQSSVEML